jgi:hypothetical protein
VIQRFCFVKLRAESVPKRQAIATELAARLDGLGVRAHVGVPADDSAARWDLSIVVEVETLAVWQALAARPAVAVVFDDIARRGEVVKAWTFEAIAAGRPSG